MQTEMQGTSRTAICDYNALNQACKLQANAQELASVLLLR
jgi:hypothetical protein